MKKKLVKTVYKVDALWPRIYKIDIDVDDLSYHVFWVSFLDAKKWLVRWHEARLRDAKDNLKKVKQIRRAKRI